VVRSELAARHAGSMIMALAKIKDFLPSSVRFLRVFPHLHVYPTDSDR
jgi:hypothetical protein